MIWVRNKWLTWLTSQYELNMNGPTCEIITVLATEADSQLAI